MRQTISVKFFARTSRQNQDGEAPIHMRMIVHICIKNGWLDRDPFVGFKMTKREYYADAGSNGYEGFKEPGNVNMQDYLGTKEGPFKVFDPNTGVT